MVRVLVVDDSHTVQELLVHIFSSDPDIEVIGTAGDGRAAVEDVRRLCPDVVTMDVYLPRIDGLEATRQIMESHPVPIVIVSASWDPGAIEKTFRAIEAGAVAVVATPKGIRHPDHERTASELVQTVKLMSEVKVVRRWARLRRGVPSAPPITAMEPEPSGSSIRLVAIGSSTGGPPVLQTILSGLPDGFPVSVLIVHHIAPGFLEGLIGWLSHTSRLQLHVAAHGETPLPGHAYFAPSDLHLGMDSSGRIVLSRDDPENGVRPSVSYLFRSLAQTWGRSAVGVLLTGMGKDGAEELGLLREMGAITIAQDLESSVVYGMPGEAVRIGAATHVLPPDRIVASLRRLAGP